MLRERDLGLELLVIRRAENEFDPWSGHMALPGGGREPGDESVYDTARRETLEEIGIDLDEGRFLGRLDDLDPRPRTMPGQLVVSTVVVAIETEPGPLDPCEVVEAFWVPVDRLVHEEVEIPDFPGKPARVHLQRSLRHLGPHPAHPHAAVGFDHVRRRRLARAPLTSGPSRVNFSATRIRS